MEIEELTQQFAELDSLWSSCPNELDVRLNETGESIVVTRSYYDYNVDVSTPLADEARPRHDFEAYAKSCPHSIGQSYESLVSGQMRSPFQSVEEVMRIDISDARIPEGYISQRMTLEIDSCRAGWLPEVKLIGLGATGIYEVVEDYCFPIDYCSIGRAVPRDRLRFPDGPASHLCDITVKAGFQFDRASVPRIFWTLVSKDDLSNVGPLFHDLLYRYEGKLRHDWVKPYTTFSRREADNLFFHLMARSGVTSWRVHVVYQAVCYFSSFAWGRHRRPLTTGSTI